MPVTFGVLGPVTAWDAGGAVLGLKGPRHRAVLARLIIARRRMVPVSRLVGDLWDDPPPGAVGAVRTFVADLRRALEPDRPPRTAARLLVTEGPGYALRADPAAVDSWRFEDAVRAAADLPPAAELERLDEALRLWRGPSYAEVAHADWARTERARLAELRLQAVERRARAQLALGAAAAAIPDLNAHVAEHPWREEAWALLATALYRTGRQAESLALLRRARTALADHLGLDPSPQLRRLESDILTHHPRLNPVEPIRHSRPATTTEPDLPRPTSSLDTDLPRHSDSAPPLEPASAQRPRSDPAPELGPADHSTTSMPVPGTAAGRVWSAAAAAYDRAVTGSARTHLDSTVGLLRGLAVTGGSGLELAREHRLAAITAAEEFGDPDLTARVIGAYDVPAIWTRSDDPWQAEQIVAASERTLAALPDDARHDPARCRLLATIAVEMRGSRAPRGPQAARLAEDIARRLDDPALLVFALNGKFMQSCTRAGLAAERDETGSEIVDLGVRHGMANAEILGRLIRVQARAALADFTTADTQAAAVDDLADRHERPLATPFTDWYRALRLAANEQFTAAENAYREAAKRLEGAGMPGVERGLLPLALLSLRLSDPNTSAPDAAKFVDRDQDWGPYRPWIQPLILLREDRHEDARTALHALPQPPADLMYEAQTCLEAAAALALGDRKLLRDIQTRLLPAANELAGAGSGLITLGPVRRWLTAVAEALA
ncbi:BTAD domain-containing putative transcriptional regulator [Nocardia blacklockiae]|uniref:BTAD domain-containing putative transcriptional regulator n=1 Tax=Nocardia blacklockiae TaxID=480036 RepID=UPI0018946665|nr:BTAD domain-containing putative transcriptional regulator [Nocardia blacklockiae]MBF6172001.1 AfsR/SARP family transcriptional regulator [Nocardia blacklockiae]